jgi:hypothetical protein
MQHPQGFDRRVVRPYHQEREILRSRILVARASLPFRRVISGSSISVPLLAE